MKPTVILHPLKRIHFSYKSEATLSQFETKFIERYKELHDELATIKDQLLQLNPVIEIVAAEFKNVKKAFDKLREKIIRTECMIGIGAENEVTPGPFNFRPEEINKVLNEFQNIRSGYWGIMLPMHNQFNVVYKRFTDFDDKVELFEKEFSEPLFRNFEIMEIDIRCFDEDMNEFRAKWMAIANLQETCLDKYTDWAKHQTVLVNDSSVLYDRIKKLYQHLNEMQDQDMSDNAKRPGLN
ncbi:hypothetical protein [Terrimonas alba]|uniref:hypothetical protein n=1 Tax=Terrimonas alba TaxID=3349636 RepID=UPI0035F4CC1F